MSKKLCLKIEWLPHDVVEHILERTPVESLLRFKSVSKNWKSTIESRLFQNRQLKHRQQSGDPDVLMVTVIRYEDAKGFTDPDIEPLEIESLRTLVLGSSSSVKIPTPWENTYHFVSQNSCDGLVCVYFPVRSGFVVNPATRWHRPLPLSNFQQRIIDIGEENLPRRFFGLGFGKDKFTGTFKPVWLYNSSVVGLKNATTSTCEVFDFSSNAWRYVTPSAPYRVTGHEPAYVDGSIYFFTDCVETKVLSLDLHTKAFQVISPVPFPFSYASNMVMANLDNRLCVSTNMNWPIQDVWLFNLGNKTWDKMYSLDLIKTHVKLDLRVEFPLVPLALLDGKKKKKLLYCGRDCSQTLAIHDPETTSCDAAFTDNSIGFPVCYFPSLVSI